MSTGGLSSYLLHNILSWEVQLNCLAVGQIIDLLILHNKKFPRPNDCSFMFSKFIESDSVMDYDSCKKFYLPFVPSPLLSAKKTKIIDNADSEGDENTSQVSFLINWISFIKK